MLTSEKIESVPTPFLRWAGGKSKIVNQLIPFTPSAQRYKHYIEPFLGGGALFFAIRPDKALLADLNKELINCYQQVALHPNQVWNLIQRHRANHSKRYYYSIRELTDGTAIERAARFIYINKTAFNGIYRVNREGKFNVPYGPSESGPALPNKSELQNASQALSKAEFTFGDFKDTCSLAKQGDFIYLDPPYPPSSKSANFTHYTADRFGVEDQDRVAQVFKSLDMKGCLVMLSNSDVKVIRELYSGFDQHRLQVTRWLGSNGDRFKVHELVITNYDVQKYHPLSDE
jgi:DNA adenine methylase